MYRDTTPAFPLDQRVIRGARTRNLHLGKVTLDQSSWYHMWPAFEVPTLSGPRVLWERTTFEPHADSATAISLWKSDVFLLHQ